MHAIGTLRRAAAKALLVALVGGCQAAGGGASPRTPGATAESSGPTASADVEGTPCTGDIGNPGDRPQNGTLLGKVDRGRILFTMAGARGGAASGSFAFAVIDPSGLHVTTTDDSTIGAAIWTPDGRILFDSSRNNDRHLFTVAADGSNAVQLTNDVGHGEYAAAFLGSDRIVFTQWDCFADGDLGLHLANADGTGIVDLTPGHPVGSPISDDQATVSPDGKAIVFVRFSVWDDSVGALFSIPAAGGTATRLTPDAQGIERPRFSPDGRSILFTQPDASGDQALWLESANGGVPRQLTTLPAGTSAYEPDWSPDGSEIVTKEYQPADGADNELHILKADGTGDHILWKGKLSTAELPDWGP